MNNPGAFTPYGDVLGVYFLFLNTFFSKNSMYKKVDY